MIGNGDLVALVLVSTAAATVVVVGATVVVLERMIEFLYFPVVLIGLIAFGVVVSRSSFSIGTAVGVVVVDAQR